MPPRAVLSDHIEERLGGRSLVAAVFLTYQFDPSFFEQDILPVFFDIPLSHAALVKLVQLEDAIREVPDGIAVYYDRAGIVPGGGAKLDVKRIPMHQTTGIFHPKNIFALVEDKEPDDEKHKARALLVSSLSANLTRTGWWENVEVCHTEEVKEGDFTRLGDDLIAFIDSVIRRAGTKAVNDHRALRSIRAFLKETYQRQTRTKAGQLHTHFYDGSVPVVEFLRATGGRSLSDMNLEIISPYFDESFGSLPLHDLIAEFSPRETRVYLPRGDKQEALCSEGVFTGVRDMEDASWGRLPAELLKSGKAEAARSRNVHAKVYRFFQPSQKREVLFVGSVNLTRAAHGHQSAGGKPRSGNLETGFLVEVDPAQRPDWWLMPDAAKAADFVHRSETEGTATGGGTSLLLRYSWNTGVAEAYWDAKGPCPTLSIRWSGVELFSLNGLASHVWTPLGAAESEALEKVLRSTSILEVRGDGKEDAFLLVQEEGMHARPSILFDLSPAEILRYWSLLTPAQRAEFLNARAPDLMNSDEGAQLLALGAKFVPDETFFDRFAGIFLAFGCLERAVLNALPGNQKEAAYRLFGQKHDSLPNLLKKVADQAAEGKGDPTEHYVTMLCARQLFTEVKKAHSEFFAEHWDDAAGLEGALAGVEGLKAKLIEQDPVRMPEFLEWFERWFLPRATPAKKVEGGGDD
jgi:hypothetical protein